MIVKDGEIIVTSINKTREHNDVSAHAEIAVMRKAQKLLQTDNLSGYTIYSNCEPCPMCAFMIRELRFSKVVFAIHSPLLGGYSRWKILQDERLSQLCPPFGNPPDIIAGLLEEEAAKSFTDETFISIHKFKGIV